MIINKTIIGCNMYFLLVFNYTTHKFVTLKTKKLYY